MGQSTAIRVRVGRRRTIVIPKRIADELGIEEGSVLELRVSGDSIVLRLEPTALDLALRGKKYASITLEELEDISMEEQRKLARERSKSAT